MTRFNDVTRMAVGNFPEFVYVWRGLYRLRGNKYGCHKIGFLRVAISSEWRDENLKRGLLAVSMRVA